MKHCQLRGGGWGCAIGEAYCEARAPIATVIISHSPAAGTPDRVCGSKANRGDIGDAPWVQLLAVNDCEYRDDPADQAAPEHEAAAAPERGDVLHENDVIDFRAEQPADDGGEDEIPDRLGVITAALQLALRDHLRD